MLGPHRRQNAKGLPILFLQPGLRSLGVLEGRRAHRAGPNLKVMVLPHAIRGPGKGMLAPKVRKHPFQSSRPSPWSDAQTLGQRAQVALRGAAPDAFAHRNIGTLDSVRGSSRRWIPLWPSCRRRGDALKQEMTIRCQRRSRMDTKRAV